MELRNISYLHTTSEIPLQRKFILHHHPDTYELIFLLRGDVTFLAEGCSYDMHPYDICIAGNNELHQIVHHSLSPYERIVAKININFFMENHCAELRGIFMDRKPGQQNLISHDMVCSSRIPELFRKIDAYFEQGNQIGGLCVLVEILSILNKASGSREAGGSSGKNVNEIINYIHEHHKESITLDSVARHFFINKQYLCKVFKSATGLTVSQYINLQRYMYVESLAQEGIPKAKSVPEAGFGTYAAYYKFRKKYARLYSDG